jgi:hypothetical protein
MDNGPWTMDSGRQETGDGRREKGCSKLVRVNGKKLISLHGCDPPFVGVNDAEALAVSNKCLAIRNNYTSFPPESARAKLAILITVLLGEGGKGSKGYRGDRGARGTGCKIEVAGLRLKLTMDHGRWTMHDRRCRIENAR